MDLYSTETGAHSQPGGSPSQTDHKEAPAEAGEAAPGAGCTCGFCDGVEVEAGTDPRTGEKRSFERMSRRPKCPVCGGRNTQYRSSYTAHGAEVARREGRTRHAYFVTLVLDREAADRAGVDGEASYKVLCGTSGVWTRSRRAIKRRDQDARYLGTLSARPSDGRWHAHVLLLTSCTRHELRKALHVTGADSYISSPDGESHERFGARKSAYAFDNAATSKSARFISSGGGVGYDSAEAVQRRREAVSDKSESDSEGDDPAPARCPNRNQQREPEKNEPADEPESGAYSPHEAETSAEAAERAPPVRCDGSIFGGIDAYLRAVTGTLTRRVGSAVHVEGLGRCKLLKVAREVGRDGTELDRLECTVFPLDVRTDRTTKVRWNQISAVNVPLIYESRTTARNRMPANENESAETDEAVERFFEEARYSKVTTELADGRRRVTVKDHETGEVTERIKPPRE